MLDSYSCDSGGSCPLPPLKRSAGSLQGQERGQVTMSGRSDRVKASISVFVNCVVLGIALYVQEIRHLPSALQLLLIAFLAMVQSITGRTFDYIREKTANIKLRSEADQVRLSERQTRRDLDELKQVVVSFLEHSEIYREKIKDHLRLAEDYLCIVKSSEGLSGVFNAMDRKEMLPFASVLMRIPGTVRPFERIGLFLIPIKSLPGINEWNIRSYVGKQIIPKVEEERERFLGKSSPEVAAKADPFSYKYMAFVLRRGSIAYDVLNRKFNREFNAFIVDGQPDASYAAMKNELARVVKTKELLALVNWASFADLNEAQRTLVEQCRLEMSLALSRAGVNTLPQLAEMPPQQFVEAVWAVLRDKSTERKVSNIATKVVAGARNTVDILRRNGVAL